MFNVPKTSSRLQVLGLTGVALLALLPAGASVPSHPSAKLAKVTPPMTGGAKTVTVTDAQNNAALTLEPGDSLIVRLKSTPGTGYSWNVITDPGFPLNLISHRYIAPAPPAGAPIAGRGEIEEFRFSVPSTTALGSSSIGLWQRFVYLRSFEPGIKDARVWQIDVTLRAPRAR